MKFDEKYLLKILDAHAEDTDAITKGYPAGCGRILSLIMHCLIMDKKPRYMVEFSPAAGGSTIGLALAMKKLQKPGCFSTFEIKDKPEWRRVHSDNMNKYGLENYVERIIGDALVETPRVVKQNNLHGKIDFCFVDSDHGAAFAHRYIKEIFPLFAPDCTICIHDIAAKTSDPYGEFNTNMIPDPRTDELLHALVGGKDTCSASLPWNQKILSKIKEKTSVDIVKNEVRGAPVAIVLNP